MFRRALAILVLVCITAARVSGQSSHASSDTGRIAALLEKGRHYLDRSPAHTLREDSAILFFARALRLSDSTGLTVWRDKTLLLLGGRYLRTGMLKQGKDYFMQAIGDYRRSGDKALEAEAWLQLGNAIPASPEENLPEKISSFGNARSLFRLLGQPLKETDAFRGLAQAHLEQGKLDLAENELQQVLRQYKDLGFQKLHYTYDLLAEVDARRDDENRELVYRLQSIKSMEATGDTVLAHYDYSRLALIYGDLDMLNESVVWISRSLESQKRQYEFGDFYGDLSLLVYDLLKLGKPSEAIAILQRTIAEVPPTLPQRVDMNEMFGNCYTELKQYDKASRYYQEMMRDFKLTSFNKKYYSTHEQMVLDYIHYYEIMGTFYVRTRQYKKARYYLDKILAMPPGAVPSITLIQVHRMQFAVDSASGNYIPAIRHYEQHKRLSDSLFNATKNKQIAELQIEYKTNQKDQSIKMLQMQSKSQETELQKVNLQRDITIAGIVTLLIIAGLAYNGYHNKQRSNKALQIKQAEINKQNLSLQQLVKEKEWLLKEVHHRVKNNLQIVISLLNTQTDFLDNPSALNAIQESRERMQAIALIHQKLYQQDTSTLINMHAYIHELISYLVSSLANSGRIYFDLDIDDINLDVSQAVPLGLIINEAITNAVKYAFPRREQGTIAIQLYAEEQRGILLTIADNGVGFPHNTDLSGKTSLGIQLMKLFAEQLDGRLRFISTQGVEISLRFNQQLAN